METVKLKLPLKYFIYKIFVNILYKTGILHYKITSYRYISTKDKISEISKTGYQPIKKYNYSHLTMRKRMEKLENRQKESLDRKNVDWGSLNKVHITI